MPYGTFEASMFSGNVSSMDFRTTNLKDAFRNLWGEGWDHGPSHHF